MTFHLPPQDRDPETETNQRPSDSTDSNCYEWMNIALGLVEAAAGAWEKGMISVADSATARAQVYATLASSPHLDKVVPRPHLDIVPAPEPARGGVGLEEL